MTNTFVTMINRIDDETERGGTETANIKLAINDAIQFYRSHRFWFLEQPSSATLTSSTTASNQYVSRYTGLITLDSLRLTVNSQLWRLTPVSFERMERLHDGTVATGQPWHYCLYGDRVRFYPTPAAIYTLTWSGTFQDPTTLSADSDTNVWMTEGEQLIRHRAKKTFMRDVLRDRPEEVVLEQQAENEALFQLERETLKRSSRRRIKAGA